MQRILLIPAMMIVASLISAFFAVPSGAAQETSEPGTQDTLWLHIKASPRTYWTSFNQAEDDHDSSSAGYNALGFTSGSPGVASWTMTLTPGLTDAVTLDPAGMVHFTIYIGACLASADTGRVTVASTLSIGSTVVASADGKDTLYQGVKNELTWSVAPQAFALEPEAGDVKWSITASGAGSQICLGAGGSQHSRIQLPVVASSPSVETQNATVENAILDVSHSFSNATSAIHNITWTQGPANASIAWNVTVTNGTLSLEVRDGAGNTVAATNNVSASESRQENVTGAVPGNWTVRVEYMDFVGVASFSISAVAEAEPAPTADDGNATAVDESQAPVEAGGGIPAPSVLLVAATLGAASLVVRRHRTG